MLLFRFVDSRQLLKFFKSDFSVGLNFRYCQRSLIALCLPTKKDGKNVHFMSYEEETCIFIAHYGFCTATVSFHPHSVPLGGYSCPHFLKRMSGLRLFSEKHSGAHGA